MKRKKILFSSTLLLFLLSISLIQIVAGIKEIPISLDFEDTDQWLDDENVAGSGVEWTTEQAHSTTHSIKCDNPFPNEVYFYIIIEESEITVSTWVYFEDFGGSPTTGKKYAVLSAKTDDLSEEEIVAHAYYDGTNIVWQLFSAKLGTDVSDVSVEIDQWTHVEIEVQLNVDATLNLVVDDVTVCSLSGDNSYEGAFQTAGYMRGWYVENNDLQNGDVYYDDLSVDTYPEELVIEPTSTSEYMIQAAQVLAILFIIVSLMIGISTASKVDSEEISNTINQVFGYLILIAIIIIVATIISGIGG